VKIKGKPEEFVVEEILHLPTLIPSGKYAIFRLEKKSLTTLDCVSILSRYLRLPRENFHCAGLKDRHALTVQYLSIRGFPPPSSSIHQQNFSLIHLGYADEPITSKLLRGNRFKILLRHIARPHQKRVLQAIQEISRFGVVNYFDEQRFGSARHGKGFFAERLLKNDPEGALKLFLAQPSREDPARFKSFKRFLSRHWGNWEKALPLAPSRSEQRLLAFLKDHPNAFRQAVNRIPSSLLSLFLNAYQSYLWNEMAILILQKFLPDEPFLIWKHPSGSFYFYQTLSEDKLAYFRQADLPLVDAKATPSDPLFNEAFEEVLSRERLTPKDFRLPWLKTAFFKSVPRPFLLFPESLQITPFEPDEFYPGRLKAWLRCTLPPASYATLIVKRIQTALPL